MRTNLLVLLIVLAVARISLAAPIPVTSVDKLPDGLLIHTTPGALRLQVWDDGIIRVVYATVDPLPEKHSFSVIATPANTKWDVKQTDAQVILNTGKVTVSVDRKSAAVTFSDTSGQPLLKEVADGGKSLLSGEEQAQKGPQVHQAFELPDGEALFGLGQHQQGVMNWAGKTVHLQQKNMEVAVPVLMSSRGYGLLWDNPSITDINAGADPAHAKTITWDSEAGNCIDYYFFAGPELDQAIGEYRELTGKPPLFARYAWGFWQCKEHYESQQDLLGVLETYRSMHIPIDNVIQDWFYWNPQPWGSHFIDPTRYPDPAAMMEKVHADHAHMIISVWARFAPGSDNYKQLLDAGYLYDSNGKSTYYDPFNPPAREMYWRQMRDELFSKGFDGWWLDASEPELNGKWGEFRNAKTAAGSGTDVFNAFPLLHTTSVYQGQRATTSDKRVFILTRSAYAGQQRNAAVTWSGDIQGKWDVFANQIPAGINFSMSGIPYWNTDIGGFFAPKKLDAAYTELFTRWFQFGTFCPMFRVHGTTFPKEMWRFGPETMKTLVRFDRLRYRLLPYIYSTSWSVTHDNDTMMRGLAMDFRSDPAVYGIADQYLFGRAIMVAPVTQAGAASRKVYLPKGSDWTDFWTGKRYDGGQSIDAPAPIDSMPLLVKSGSILPLGPVMEYSTEKPADPIELRVYRGADGDFTLYEDENDNYNYEKGAYATIPIHWKDSTGTLTIGDRNGDFPGMIKSRTFRIVWVNENHGGGIEETEKADTELHYQGQTMSAQAPTIH